jgi:hypothetical protein
MAESPMITREIARGVGDRLGVDWNAVEPAEFRRGLEVEVAQAAVNPAPPGIAPETTTGTADDPLLSAGRIVSTRLREVPDFYTRLDELAAAAEKHLSRRFRI